MVTGCFAKCARDRPCFQLCCALIERTAFRGPRHRCRPLPARLHAFQRKVPPGCERVRQLAANDNGHVRLDPARTAFRHYPATDKLSKWHESYNGARDLQFCARNAWRTVATRFNVEQLDSLSPPKLAAFGLRPHRSSSSSGGSTSRFSRISSLTCAETFVHFEDFCFEFASPLTSLNRLPDF